LACVLALGCALVVADARGADKGGKKVKGKKAKGKKKGNTKRKIHDAELIGELNLIHATMKKADPIYKGHRGKAMHLVNKAVGHLSKEMHARGLKDRSKHVADESLLQSNLDMASAG